MKKLLFVISAALMIVACAPQNGFTLKGKFTSDNAELLNGPIYLISRAGVADTAEMVNGEFSFAGELAEPTDYYLLVGSERLPLFLENAKYTVNADLSNLRKAKIEGGETQTLLNKMQAIAEEVQAGYNLDSLAQAFNMAKTPEEREQIYAVFQAVNDEIDARKKELIENNKDSYFAFREFSSEFTYIDYEQARATYEYYAAIPKFQKLSLMARIKEHLDRLENLQVGKQAPDFTMNDPDGKPITFSDIYKKNKVTMLDFWAGWCGPCRQFNPTLVEIYNEYHAKGFEVLGVSLDSNRKQWLDAIKADKLTWPQVSELKQWDTEVAKTYGVRYIPQNLFVDQNGVIIARVLSEGAIVDFLNEQLQ